jgi:hypothetical protein
MEMNRQITFARFEQIITKLGFAKKMGPQKGVAYFHSPTDTILLVRSHKPSDLVPWHVLASSRVQLDGRGIVSAEEYERMLETAAAGG